MADTVNAQITDAFRSFQNSEATKKDVLPYTPSDDAENELLFFVKPEVTTQGPDALAKVLDIAGDAFDEYDVDVTGATILGAPYLAEHGLISQHYGVINEIARTGVDGISEEAKETFADLYGVDAAEATILGAFEFLRAYPSFDERSLNVLFDNCDTERLASGTYCAEVHVFDETVYLLNGFHPFQILHFTQPGASIVACTVQSNTAWDVLRGDMTGATNPEDAVAGSIRRTLLERREDVGLAAVDQGNNGVHLSAGALEGLAEILRFVSDHDAGTTLAVDDTAAGRAFLNAGFDADTIAHLLTNPTLDVDGDPVSAFDLTEEIDTSDAIARLKAALGVEV